MWNYETPFFLNEIQRFQILVLCVFCKVIISIFCPLTLPNAKKNSSRLWGLWIPRGLWRPQMSVDQVGNPVSGVSSDQNGTQFFTQTPKSVLQIIYQKDLSRILVYLMVWSAVTEWVRLGGTIFGPTSRQYFPTAHGTGLHPDGF